MKHLNTSAVIAGIVLWTVAAYAAQPGEDLIKELTSEAAAKRTPEDLQAAYAKLLASLIPGMGAPNIPDQASAQQAYQRLCFHVSRPGADNERLALCRATAAALVPETPMWARVWMMRQMERIGRAEVVPAIAAQLADKEALVRETARRALQNNPAPEAAAALRKALEAATEPAWKSALIDALAYRPGAENSPAIMKFAADPDDNVRSSALAALAKAGEKGAADAIAAGMDRGSPRARAMAADAYLLLADRLLAAGDKAAARAMYARLLSADGHLRCAALIGIGRVGMPDDLKIVLDAMSDEDVRIRGAAIEAIGFMASPQVMSAISEKVKSAAPAMKASLLRALANRADRSMLPTFVACAADADENVQIEALKGIALVGDASVVGLLLKTAAAGGKAQEFARAALDRIADREADAALLAALQQGDAKTVSEAIRALSMRRSAQAAEPLLKFVEHSDAQVRQEAARALGLLAPPALVDRLLALLAKADDATRNELANAIALTCRRIPDDEGQANPVLKALPGAQGQTKAALVGILSRLAGARALEAVKGAIKDADPAVQDAAIRALADWPDFSAADDLLALARSAGNDRHKVLALRGYVRLVGLPSGRKPAETLAMYSTALSLATTPDVKRQILGGLGEIRTIPSLKLAAPLLDDASVREEAANTCVRIARDTGNAEPEFVRATMEKVLGITKDKNRAKEAQDVINRVSQAIKK